MVVQKYALVIGVLASCLSASVTFASTQALQYDPSNDTTKAYTIPLDKVDHIITDGQYSWAIEDLDLKSNTNISFYDGQSWQAITTMTGMPTIMDFTTYNYDATAIATLPYNQGTAFHYFSPDKQGHYAWSKVDLNSDNWDMAHGRIWDVQTPVIGASTLEVNQDENSTTMTPITDATSQAAIPIMTNENHAGHAAYDSLTQKDYFTMYAIASNQQGFKTNAIQWTTCSVAHDAIDIAKDVRCKKHIIHTQPLFPTLQTYTMAITRAVWLKDAVTPIFTLELTTSTQQYDAQMWSKDGGATWQASVPYTDDYHHGVFTYEKLGAPYFCPYASSHADSTGHVFDFPPKFPCLNLQSQTVPAAQTYYILNATDLTESEVSGYSLDDSVSTHGLWMSEYKDTYRSFASQHIYFIPFDTTQTQSELPNVPYLSVKDQPSFAIYQGGNATPDTIVSCGYVTDPKSPYPMQAGNLRVEIADNTGGQWQWHTAPVSIPKITLSGCQVSTTLLSQNQMDYTVHNSNPVFTSNTPIWIYPLTQ